MATDVQALNFHYDVVSDQGILLKSRMDEGIPTSVLVEVHFSDQSGDHFIKRYLPVPVGG
jgi:hypothetical protein